MAIRATIAIPAMQPEATMNFPFLYRLASGVVYARVYKDDLREREGMYSDIIVLTGPSVHANYLLRHATNSGLPDVEAWSLRLKGDKVTLGNETY